MICVNKTTNVSLCSSIIIDIWIYRYIDSILSIVVHPHISFRRLINKVYFRFVILAFGTHKDWDYNEGNIPNFCCIKFVTKVTLLLFVSCHIISTTVHLMEFLGSQIGFNSFLQKRKNVMLFHKSPLFNFLIILELLTFLLISFY